MTKYFICKWWSESCGRKSTTKPSSDHWLGTELNRSRKLGWTCSQSRSYPAQTSPTRLYLTTESGRRWCGRDRPFRPFENSYLVFDIDHSIYIYIYEYIYIYIYIVCINYIYIYMYIFMWIIYIGIHVYIYIYMYIYIYI